LSPQESEFEAEWEFCITEKWVLWILPRTDLWFTKL
jgi:hypothetical protein